MTNLQAIYAMQELQHIKFVLEIRNLDFDSRCQLLKTANPILIAYYKNMFWDKDFEEMSQLYNIIKKNVEAWAEENIEISAVKELL